MFAPNIASGSYTARNIGQEQGIPGMRIPAAQPPSAMTSAPVL
jgi:hypothetical protein